MKLRLAIPLLTTLAAVSQAQERPPSRAASSERSLSSLVKTVSPAVVTIVAYDEAGAVLQQGSGFFTSDKGEFVTNHHVVVGAAQVEVRTNDGKSRPVKALLAEEAAEDLAWLVVETSGETTPFLRLTPGQPEVGERIVVVSSPYGLAQTVSEGIVSATDRDLPSFADMLQISAPISPGSSGAPVVNFRGEIVGVVTAQMVEGQSLNFATPSRRVFAMMRKDDEPINEESAFFKGLTLSRRRQFAEARPLLEAASKEEKDVTRVLFPLGRTYAELGEHETAIATYRRILETKPDDPFLHLLIGDVYGRMNQPEKAIEAYRAAHQAKADFVPALMRLGEACLTRKEYDEATRMFQRAAELEAESPWTQVWLGKAYAAQNRYREAIAAYTQAIRLNADDSGAHFHLGIAYLGFGRRDLAFDEYRILKPLDEKRAATLFDALYASPEPSSSAKN